MRDTQPTLPTDRAHDLPPRWDGHVVVWDGWEAGALSDVRLCPPLPRECCPACGSLAETTTNRGRVARSGITTRQQIAARDASRRQLGWASHNRRTGLYLVTGPENLPGVDGVYLANLPTFGAAVDAALLLLLTATDVEDPDVIHDFASLYPKAHITTRKDT